MICRKQGCYRLAWNTYCKHHKCHFCNNRKTDFSDYCYICKCRFVECREYAIENFLYCYYHKCLEYECDMPCDMGFMSKFNDYCIQHQKS